MFNINKIEVFLLSLFLFLFTATFSMILLFILSTVPLLLPRRCCRVLLLLERGVILLALHSTDLVDGLARILFF